MLSPPCTPRLTCAPYSYENKCHASSVELICLSPSKDNMFWKYDSIVLAETMPSSFLLFLLVFPPERREPVPLVCLQPATSWVPFLSEQEAQGRNKRSKKQRCSNANYQRILYSKPSNPEAQEYPTALLLGVALSPSSTTSTFGRPCWAARTI